MLLGTLLLASVLTANVVETRFQKYLCNDASINELVKIDNEGVTIEGLEKVRYASVPVKQNKPLRKIKIAIDPGHFGGDYAKLEHRSFLVGSVRLQEGDLTLKTAHKLRELLVNAGYDVFMTREMPGQGASSEMYDNEEPFKAYNIRDLKERARLINAYGPDLTVCIHYNIHSGGEGNVCAPVPHNFCCAFVPGGFGEGELVRLEDKGDLLRLLLTDDLEKSIELSRCILASFEKNLGVPCQTNRSHLKHICKWAGRGIFARNLVLTRKIAGPICYGETLCMDSEEEYLALTRNRPHEAAFAYFNGIESYLAEPSYSERP
ncbi:MAG: hypothetical protein SP1CHLAM54_11480 [Chlamydiia bacterium]|nr:hypothetical protein [Chlamydiia bacterium]MCH9616051.1 hypothetical protein [Chlamydiia bacterium]MCH9629074.1 hypothetical protein [Chlamydiia bacterium]